MVSPGAVRLLHLPLVTPLGAATGSEGGALGAEIPTARIPNILSQFAGLIFRCYSHYA